MNTSHILAFSTCLKTTFRDMLSVEMTQGPIAEHVDYPVRADVSACITISSRAPACVVLAFDADSAMDAAERFTQTKSPFEDPMVGDTAREILNILVGSAQREISEKFEFSLPISIQGRNHEVSCFRKGRNIFCDLHWGTGKKATLFLNLPAL